MAYRTRTWGGGRLLPEWLLLIITLIHHISPGIAVPRCANPATPYTVSDATDLEQVLTAWSSGRGCQGTVLFTKPSAIYALSKEVVWPAGGILTLDASSAPGAVIEAAPDSRIISTGKAAKLRVIGLELRGGHLNGLDDGGAVSVGESSFFKVRTRG